MATTEGSDVAPQNSLPPHLAACVATARDRCQAMRFALQAYSGLEKLLTLAHQEAQEQSHVERAEVAALLRLITDEARHRLEAAIGAVDEVGEEVAIHRERE